MELNQVAGKQTDDLLSNPAYQALQNEVGACGAYPLASASVAVPFVGAATGALAVARLIRLASMETARTLLQLDMGSPDMVIDSTATPALNAFPGGDIMDLASPFGSNFKRGG